MSNYWRLWSCGQLPWRELTEQFLRRTHEGMKLLYQSKPPSGRGDWPRVRSNPVTVGRGVPVLPP
jgi:hypothetical protein